MKIGILTFHDGLNHGAYLQAYSTMITLRNFGYDPIVINYKNSKHWMMEDVKPWFSYRRPVRFVDHYLKQRAFRADHTAFPLTPYTRNPDKLTKLPFDAVVFGSDVIWDTSLFGYDPIYFGGINARKRIAYAASCGSEDFTGDISRSKKDGLQHFDHISVRDENTCRFVESATGEKPPIVLDPVFLPSMDMLLPAVKRDVMSPFVLVYGGQYTPEDACVIRDYAEKKNLKVISVGARNLWADKSFLRVGPLEILNYFRAAEFVFSSTFHGAVFSIRCEKNFVVRLHSAIWNKATYLLKLLGCPERGAGELRLLKGELDIKINYDVVNSCLDREIKRSLGFLEKSLV